ncbi:CotH kinase family protein [Verrucomicrobiaceae bacterium 227]
MAQIVSFAACLVVLSLPCGAELVSHYPFDNPGNPGEDLGSFSNDGAANGNARFSTDARLGGGSLLLDGSADYLDLGGGADFSSLEDDGDGFTIAAWVKPDSLTGVRRIFSRGMSGGFSGSGWGVGMSGASPFATTYGVRDFNADSNDFVTGAWTHVAYVFRPAAGQVRFYINGVFVTTKSGGTGINDTNADFIIGGIALPGDGQWFSGRIDDLRIYREELPFATISDLANPVEVAVEQFYANPAPLRSAGPVTLSWVTSGAETVILNGGSFSDEVVGAIDEITVGNLPATTTFTLTVEKSGVVASREVVVAVTTTSQPPLITEFVAGNTKGLQDEDGEFSDWIEIHNRNPFDLSLAGWHLTDDASDFGRWEFPALSMAPNSYLVVFASGKDRRVPGSELHTDFKLSLAGEYLALTGPDEAVVQEFSPAYPEQLEDYSYGGSGSFYLPSPGAPNGSALSDLPPTVSFLTRDPGQPTAIMDLPISATVLATGSAVSLVNLHYRVGFANEVSVPMTSAGGDDYAAVIPSSTYSPGEMVRWYVTAVSEGGSSVRFPSFDDPLESPQYYGTVVLDDVVTTPLPVLHWFVQNTGASETRTGTQASLFYDGEFYDNVYCRIRGQSAGSWPKHKFKFDFPSDGKFRFNGEGDRAEEFNMQSFYREMFTQSSNTSYMREPMMLKWMQEAGVDAPDSFHWQVRRNGEFYGLFAFVEQVDDEFLKRRGYDQDGEMYKAAWQGGGPATLAPNPISGQYRKETVKTEPWTNFTAFCAGVNSANRFEYVWDNVDVAQWINVMASMNVPFNHDQLTKNYYVYRDPGSGEWHRFPWDTDQSFPIGQYITGENWTNPLYGDANHTQELNGGSPNPIWRNRMHAAILDNPVTREMYLRRVKTLADKGFVDGAGGTNYFEDQVAEWQSLLATDAAADRSFWAARGVFLSTMQAGVNEILNVSLPARQSQLLQTYAQGGVIPLLPDSQSMSATVAFGAIEYQPASGNQDEEYLEITNPGSDAVDLSGWVLEGGVDHIFPGGTVIAAGESLFLSPDVRAFRARATSPTGGESRFVQGNYSGHISNLGEVLTIKDESGALVTSITTPVAPSEAQLYLVVSEIMYHPLDDDSEFIELMNVSDAVTLDLGGVAMTSGVDYVFPAGVTLAPGGRLVVPFASFANLTRLSNGGEEIKLEGAGGETIQEFLYDDEGDWPVFADGQGASLVLICPEQRPDPSLASSWRASAYPGGSPGGSDGTTFVGNAAEDADSDGASALVEYALGGSDAVRGGPLFTIEASVSGDLHLFFSRNLSADDVKISIESSGDLGTWNNVVDASLLGSSYLGNGLQAESWSIPGDGAGRQFVRMKVELIK